MGPAPRRSRNSIQRFLLGQVYAVIAYYLAHTAEVDDYLRIREHRAAEVRQASERLFNPTGVCARLMARQTGQGSA
jgi:hypothetical protein